MTHEWKKGDRAMWVVRDTATPCVVTEPRGAWTDSADIRFMEWQPVGGPQLISTNVGNANLRLPTAEELAEIDWSKLEGK